MQDPRKPPKIHATEWALHLRSEDEDASPLHAWAFFAGFILFPLWWLAAFWPIPRTRRVGDTDAEKAVTLDDPQVEHGAWLGSGLLAVSQIRGLQTPGHGAIGAASCLGLPSSRTYLSSSL